MNKRTIPALLLAASMLLALPACAKNDALPPPSSAQEPSQSFQEDMETFASLTAAEVLSVYENTCYSPISLYFALSMAATGAAGSTQDQIYGLLGAENTETLAEDCGNLYGALYRDEEGSKLFLANSIWTRQDITPKEEYARRLSDSFYAEQFSVDFGDAKVNSDMTDWVKEHTQGLLAPEFDHDGDTVEVLLNTIYFKDAWLEPFYESKTERDLFYTACRGGEQVDFMHTYTVDSALLTEDYACASLPFVSGGEMFFILPQGENTLEKLMRDHGVQELLSTEGEEQYAITWSVPKFQWDGELDLIPMLQTLGIIDAFDADLADFSAASDADAYISAIRQGTYFSVDEAGVEAAAFTEISKDESAPMPPEKELDMNLNQPFLYGVRSADGTLLFVGVCVDPAG